MPAVITLADSAPEPTTLEECTDALAANGFNARCEESLHHGAQWLGRLGQNRDFLADRLVASLAEDGGLASFDSAYSPQCIMLSTLREGFFIRANIWPSEADSCYRTSGAHSFAYGAAHDHNFDFLTTGYFGPGYASDYYEYDYRKVAGYVGEPAGLRFVERSVLSPGKILHYRAHRDVHAQLPPESLSVSLNIMGIDAGQSWYDQYAFDVDANTIKGIISPGSGEVFLRMAVALGTPEACDLAETFARSHPSDRMRLAAFEARADNAGGDAEREAVWREAERCGRRMVAKEAMRRLVQMHRAEAELAA